MTPTWETLIDVIAGRTANPCDASAMATSRRAALYVRVSTSDRGQTVENQLQPLQEAAGRLGWTVVAIYRDEGISGTMGRDKRPGLDALLKGVARREFDIVAAWSVCRLGRSLPDLIGLLGELQIPRHRPLPAPAGARYLDAIGQDAVRDAGGVQRVRAGDDPRSGDGGTGSRSIIRQAPGQAEDDAVPGAAHSSGIG